MAATSNPATNFATITGPTGTTYICQPNEQRSDLSPPLPATLAELRTMHDAAWDAAPAPHRELAAVIHACVVDECFPDDLTALIAGVPSSFVADYRAQAGL